MTDYEFLRWLADVRPIPYISLEEQRIRIRAIADQIERLSNPPDRSESRYCVLTCGHDVWLFDPKIGQTVLCRVCENPVTVASIQFKKPPMPRKRVCELLCGHRRYVDNPCIGLVITCPICSSGMRVIAIDPPVT